MRQSVRYASDDAWCTVHPDAVGRRHQPDRIETQSSPAGDCRKPFRGECLAVGMANAHVAISLCDMNTRNNPGVPGAVGEAARVKRPQKRPPVAVLALSSPRLRACRTCDPAGLGERVEIEPDLSEWNYGAFEGLRTVDIQRERPAWNIWHDGCPQGEMPADVLARADRLIARWIGLPVQAGQHFPLHPASQSILGQDAQHPGRRLITLWNQIPALHAVDG